MATAQKRKSDSELLAEMVAAEDGLKITSGQAFATCRALWCGTAGTATIVTAGGSTLTAFPLKEGLNPISAKTVTLTTAADVWALY